MAQACARIPKRSGILDPQDPGSEILKDLGSYVFIFSWDLGDLGSCHSNIAVGSYGSWISDRKDFLGSWGSWIQLGQVMVGPCRSWILHNNMSLHLEDPVLRTKLCFWFPISIRCLLLSTVNIFIHMLIQPFYVDLKTGLPCWFLHMFSFIELL